MNNRPYLKIRTSNTTELDVVNDNGKIRLRQMRELPGGFALDAISVDIDDAKMVADALQRAIAEAEGK